jgi:hypothetical protein
VRLLLLAVLALAAVALGATREPHGGCDYDFGAGNGTAYLVVNNPSNFVLYLSITYQRGGHKYSTVLNVSNTRVIAFCGLGHGWLYIQQHESPPGTPLVWYPLADPRYVVLRAGESATMSVTTLFELAVKISIVLFLTVVIKLKPRLRRSAVYALPDTLRGMDIGELTFVLLFSMFIFILLYVLLAYELPLLPESVFSVLISLLAMYTMLSLGGFYLSFRRGVWTYYFLLISFLINIFLAINVLKSHLLFFLLFILYITMLLTSSVTLLSFYNMFMSFFLLTYGSAVLIHYDVNFERIIPWSLPLQIPGMLRVPDVLAISFLAIMGLGMIFLIVWLVYGLTMHARAVTPHTASWPPLWWWFGLGVFARDELEARSLLHRLSAGGIVVVELSKGERAIMVSADLDGMYLCRFGGRSGVCNNVEWVSYDEVKFKVTIIKRSREQYAVGRFVRKVVLPILIGVLAFFMTNYTSIPITLIFVSFLLMLLLIYYKYNDLRELKEYIQAIKQDKRVLIMHLISHVFFASIFVIIFTVLTSNLVALSHVFLIAVAVSLLSRADPELSRYLFPGLELRLIYIDGSVIGLAHGGCLQWAKGGGAPLGRAFVIRDGDCLVVVSPYVDNVRSRLRRYLCGPACPPVRVVGGEGVAVGVLDLQKRRYYYYVVDSSR